MYNGFQKTLPDNAHSRKLLKNVRREAEKLYDCEITALPYTKMVIYEKTGSRPEYEKEYDLHRKMLCAFSLMAMSETDEKWINKLCDVIWAICDEFTWALPAHFYAGFRPIKENKAEEKITVIDLFCAETGIAFSEILHILGDRLPDLVKDRMVYEIERRIINPYLEKEQRFGSSNWSAVCGCGVGSVLIYLGKDAEFERVKDRLMQNMQDFLDSNADDGCCMEGSLYWAYGFGYFCYFAELLYQYTNGEINLFTQEKVKKLAYFGQNMFLKDNYVVPFSDSPHTLGYETGLWMLLSDKYDGIIIPPSEYEYQFGESARYRLTEQLRNIFWYRDKEQTTKEKQLVVYENAGWYINCKNDYIVAAKAGHNDEPHNHNDIGCFVLFDDGEYILDDVGWAEYDKEYFTENRYNNMCASSLGHGVPVVNGCAQKSGAERCGKILTASDNSFSVEFSKAYDIEAVESLKREITLESDGILIHDVVFGKGVSFKERFITRICPEITTDGVKISNYVLGCKEECRISVSEFYFTPRFMQEKETAYIIELEQNNGTEFNVYVKNQS